MHVVNRFFLKLALLPLRMYNRMGVDPVQLKTILTTKLILDDRRPQAIAQARSRQKKEVSKSTLGTMFMSALLGSFFVFCFFLDSDKVSQLTFYFTFFFVLLSLTLITDFTSVLIDVRDNYILLPKPVSDKTIVVARLLHIFIHLCKIVLPMALPGFLYFAFTVGLYGAVLLLLLLLLLTTFAIFFINAVYMAILKFTTPQRFQAIITYVQILFAIVVYGSYQVLPRIISHYAGDAFTLTHVRGIGCYPLYWMATTWTVAYSFSGNAPALLMAVAGVLFPLAGIVLVVNYLAPAFNRKLALLSATASGPKKAPVVQQKKSGMLLHYFSRFISLNAVEKAGFLFTWKMMGRSRDFKLKVYPAIGYTVVYLGFLLFSSRKLTLARLHNNPIALKVILLSAIYFSVFILIMAIGQVVYSDKYKASWIFYTSPVASPGHLVTGAAKAVLLKFYFPVVAAICIFAIAFAGVQVLPNLVLGLSNVVMIVALLLVADKHYLPFSTQQNTNTKGGSFLKGLFLLLLAGFVGFGHCLVYSLLPVVCTLAVLSLLANWLLFDSIQRIGWTKIISSYTDV